MSDILPENTETSATSTEAESPLVMGELHTEMETPSPSEATEAPLVSEEFVVDREQAEVVTPLLISGRLTELNLAIELYPQSAANYLYRAEVFTEQRQWTLAKADFETARRLALVELEEDAWGFAAQFVLDRAERALEQFTE